MTLNNTIWTSPVNPVNSNSGCGLTLKVDSNLIEQKKRPVCQIRFVNNFLIRIQLEKLFSNKIISISDWISLRSTSPSQILKRFVAQTRSVSAEQPTKCQSFVAITADSTVRTFHKLSFSYHFNHSIVQCI